MVILFTDLYDRDGVIPGLNALRYQKFDPTSFIVSPQEAEPALLGDLRLIDGETGRARDVTVTEGLLRRYRQAFAAHGDRVERYCRSHGMATRAASQAPSRRPSCRCYDAGSCCNERARAAARGNEERIRRQPGRPVARAASWSHRTPQPNNRPPARATMLHESQRGKRASSQ